MDIAARAVQVDAETLVAHATAGPVDVAIRREEEALVWQVLQNLPDSYREPLVLFHRGGQSVAEVADQLELSEDAVKQRLARGRKLLKAEVATHVEQLLRSTRPGTAFAAAVIAALPAATPQAMAAELAAVATKSAGAKAAATTAPILAGAVLGPLLGLIGAVLGVAAAVTGARSPRERRLVYEMIGVVLGLIVTVFVAQWVSFTYFRAAYHTVQFQVVFWCVYILLLLLVILWGKRRSSQVRRVDGREDPAGDSLRELGAVPLRSLNWNLAGTMLGGSCWIAVAGIPANDWLTTIAAFFFIGYAWQRITRWLAASDTLPNRVLALIYGVLVTCAADILVSTIRWSAWQAVPGHVAQRISLWQVNTLIVVVCVGATSHMLLWYRSACRRDKKA
jgi:Ca2+/Na+ antiporter